MLNAQFNDGINFLKNDKYCGLIVQKMKPPFFPQERGYFKSLIKYIIYQQLSIKAARKIYDRLVFLFKEDKINPTNFKKLSKNRLKEIGISNSKINYMNEIADSFNNNNNFLTNIDSLSNQEIIDILIKIKGVGPWTADMFLMFTLNRLDVFPINDLGIKKGMQKLFKLDTIPNDKFIIQKSKKWSPYRTIVCLYLWKLIDGKDFDW